jgi:lysophospholipase L1-like esterase
VTAITPSSGSLTLATPVTIAGAEFAQGATVRVNGVAATNVVVVNATTITAVVPPGTAGGPAEVVVVSRGVTVTVTGFFTYVPPPTVTRVIPSEGRSLGGEVVEVQGAGFVPFPGTLPIVGFGDRSAEVHAAPAPTATSLFVRTPPNNAGFSTVTVFVNGQTASLPGGFRYYPFSSTDTILAFGDSITYGIYVIIDQVTGLPVFPPPDGGYPARLDALLDTFYAPRQTFTVGNAGVPGECAAGPFCGGNPTSGVGRLPTVTGSSAPDDLVVILEGTNDVGVFTVPEIVAALDTMVAYALGAGKKVALCTLVPKDNDPLDAAAAADVSQAIRTLKNTKYAAAPNVVLIDLHATFPPSGLGDDGIHPTAEGYAFIAQKVYDALRANFETR